MRPYRFIVAIFFGFIIYNAAVVFQGGFLAAVPVPRSYFEYFGREHAAIAHTVLNLFTLALPIAFLVFAACWVALRMLKKSTPNVGLALVVGMCLALAYWNWAFAMQATAEHPDAWPTLATAFIVAVFPSWSTLPNIVAPWVGLALAAVFGQSRNRFSIKCGLTCRSSRRATAHCVCLRSPLHSVVAHEVLLQRFWK